VVQTIGWSERTGHYVFPQDWCKRNNIGPKLCDSIVNKTPLAARTNRMIGGNAPSVYLSRIQKNAAISSERMDEQILRSHLIDPAALRGDDFEPFFRAREAALLDRIQAAMGTPISREATRSESEDVADYQPEIEADDEVAA
jgi:hypothetical protein